MHDVDLIILLCAGLVVVSVMTSVIAMRFGAPLLLLFLIVGLVAGENGPGGVIFDDAETAYLVGSAALAVILFDGGFHTKLASYRHAAGPAILMATVGVAITIAVVAAAGHYLVHLGWVPSLLLGTALSSTDAAALFFLLRVGGITIRDRVRSTLEVESGTNDPLAIFLTLTLVSIAGAGWHGDWAAKVASLVWQGVGGALMGAVGGALIVVLVNRVRLEPGLTPVAIMAFTIALFAVTNELEASGFLAAYVAGLIAGNAKLQGVGTLRRFQDGITWLAQIAMFVTLGLLATPSEFPAVSVPSLILGGVLIFIARPLAVGICLAPFWFSLRERAFIAWVGLRGAVSILLALVPTLGNVPGAPALFDIAFVVVVVSLIVQGWTVRPVAKLLRLIVPAPAAPVDRMEIDLPGLADHEIVTYTLEPEGPIAQGRELPRWARPVLLRRGGQVITAPRQFAAGDQVYFLATPAQVPLLDRLLAGETDEADAEATLYGEFVIGPAVTLRELRDAYGLPAMAESDAATLAQLFDDEYGSDLELGDRLHLGPVDLIVRAIDDGRIGAVGIALEPQPDKSLRRAIRNRLVGLVRRRA